MPEFNGTENSIALQMRLRDRQAEIARSPDLANGGRILHFLDPEVTGRDRVQSFARQDKLAGFPMLNKELAIRLVNEFLGPTWKTPAWRALVGAEDQVLSSCEAIIETIDLPDVWEITFHDCPADAEIAGVQDLNARTGVSPYPAYYMRSEAVPVLTICIRDSQKALIATASVADRYHRESRLAGHVFAGMVSVSQDHRGRGLGKLVNAIALTESHRRFGWTFATEQVAADNTASEAMIVACGLDHSAKLWSVAASSSDERFSR